MNYKNYIISRGGVEQGIAMKDIEEYLLTPAKYKDFSEFMRGQTCGLIAVIHVCYVDYFERFIHDLPVIDYTKRINKII